MLTALKDILAQYYMMLSPAAKRRRAMEAEALQASLFPTFGPGDLVIDCGANVGLITGQLAATGAEVIAYEPDPIAFAALSERHGSLPNVTLHNAAVGARDGTITLLRDRSFHKDPLTRTVRSSTVTGGRRMDDGDAVTVKLVDLPSVLRDLIAQKGEIAFLKLDVEGAEVDILEAMQAGDLFKDIRLTVAETHEKKFGHLRSRFRKLRREIAAHHPKSRVNLNWY